MADKIATENLVVHQEKAALYRLGMWLIDHRKSVAVVTYAFTAVMLYFTFKMEMFTEFGDLLPYRHPFVQVHTKFANQFGGANNISIMIEVKKGTVFNKDTLTKIFKMTQVIDTLPGINHDQIDSIGHRSTRYLKMVGGSIATPPVMRRAPATDRDVDEIRDIVHYSESLHGILVSLDDRAALIRANFFEGRVNYRQLFYDVNEKIMQPFQDDNTVIWIAGEPRLYGWIYYYTSEVWYIFAGCTIFLWILLYAYFHDWRGALRPTLTGVMSAIWGLGVVRSDRVPAGPAVAGDPVLRDRALGEPLGADARSLLRGVPPPQLEQGSGDRRRIRRAVRADAVRNHHGRAGDAGDRLDPGGDPAADRDLRVHLGGGDRHLRARAEPDHLLLLEGPREGERPQARGGAVPALHHLVESHRRRPDGVAG